MVPVLKAVPFAGVAVLLFLFGKGHPDLSFLREASLVVLAIDSCAIFYLDRRNLASPIHWGMSIFLALAAATLWIWPEGAGRFMVSHATTLLYIILLAVAVVPLLLGKEVFTMFFARKETPETLWGTSVFIKINHHLTGVWAILFFFSSLLTLVPGVFNLHGPFHEMLFRGLLPAAIVVGIGLPVTRRYPGYYQRKLGIIPPGESHSDGAARQDSFQAAPQYPITRSNTEEKETEKMADNAAIVALNGSPHCGIGNTNMMLEMLRAPLMESGFDLEIISLSEYDIKYCTGCALCMEKGACWIKDDHRTIVNKLLNAPGIILASPVYFVHVTAQMKTFIDRSLAYGHKPRPTWKPGLAVSVSAGYGETDTASYLGSYLRSFGAFSVGSLTALAVGPGEFIGKEAVEARAVDLAGDLAAAIREKRRYPATDRDLHYYQFMSDLVKSGKDSITRDDHEHWQKHGLYEGFGTYIQQKKTEVEFNNETRKAWIAEMIAEGRKAKLPHAATDRNKPGGSGPRAAQTCEDLLRSMPSGFNPDAAGGLEAVYQFEVSGSESFTAHLQITDGICTYHSGPAAKPDVIVKTLAEVWLAVSKGEMDGQQAFMNGKYKVDGDLSLLLRLKSIFSG
jgi:multimeric flavodoxin WrbA/putative sterol carrier protein